MRNPTHRSRIIPKLAILTATAAACMFFSASSLAQEPTPTQATEPKVKEKSLFDLYLAGGPLMHFILLCSMGTIAVATYCGLQFRQQKMYPEEQVNATLEFMKRKNPGGAYEMLSQNDTAFSRTMSAALLKVNFERDLANKISMEQAAAEKLFKEERFQMRWVNYLNTFATIAPMLGLLGTVTGMIEAFDKLSAGLSEPQDLAGGIGVAMITTAGGLIVGIPSMFTYFFFRNKLMTLITIIQEKVTLAIDILSGELTIQDAVDHVQKKQ